MAAAYNFQIYGDAGYSTAREICSVRHLQKTQIDESLLRTRVSFCSVLILGEACTAGRLFFRGCATEGFLTAL